MCAQELPKVAVMLCFQIWLIQEWQDVCTLPLLAITERTHLCHSWQLRFGNFTLPLLAITEHTPLPFLATPECARFGNSYIATFGNHALSTHLCHSWQLQNVPDLETVTLPLLAITEHTHLCHSCMATPECARFGNFTLPLLAITEHTPLPFLATPKCARFEKSYIATFGNQPLPFLATPECARFGNRYIAITEHTRIFATIGHYKMSQIWTHFYIASFGTS